MDKSKIRSRSKKARPQRVFEGLAVSPGVAIGPAHLRDSGEVQVLEYQVPAAAVPDERDRFEAAVKQARRQLGKLKGKAETFHGAAAEESEESEDPGELAREGVERLMRALEAFIEVAKTRQVGPMKMKPLRSTRSAFAA